MDKKILKEHQVLIFMIYELFEGSIRHEDLSDIILKTKYNDINSKTARSRLFTKLKKAKILNEMTDFDFKKRFYLNKPVLAYLKGVPSTKTSSVSRKASTFIKSNFKARYFIENYVDKYEGLDLKQLYELASKSCGNLLNSNDKYILNCICKVFDNSLTDDAMKTIIAENDAERLSRKKQLQSLKVGPVARVEQAKLKAENIDVYEEHYGDPVPQAVVSKKDKKSKQKVISLKKLKQNNVYLSDVFMDDIELDITYDRSATLKNKSTLDYSAKFKHLQTRQVTLKFVYFCPAREIKTSKMKSIYEDVQNYTNLLTVKDVITPIIVKKIDMNRDKLDFIDSKTLSEVMSDTIFDSPQVVKVVAELDVIFMNKINYKRVIKRILKHKELKDRINLLSHTPSNDYKISFRHYNFYAMNEHDPE